MKVTLRKVEHPDPDFYYRQQFQVYHEPYLIWERKTWAATLMSCDVYCVEVNGRYAGDVMLEERGKGRKYLADFSILPEFQGRGVGRSILESLKKNGSSLTAFTRKETLRFYLKCGFTVRRTTANYFSPGVDRYYVSTP